MLEKFNDTKSTNLTTISILVALSLAWASMSFFDQLRLTIEATWNVRRDDFGLKAAFRRTITTLKTGTIVLLIFIVMITIRSLLLHPYIEENIAESGVIVFVVHLVFQFSFIFIILLFLFIYTTPLKVYWKNALPGATIGAFLYVIGREIKEHMQANLAMSMAESLIMVLFWFYYSNLVFVYAAEFNKVYISQKQGVEIDLYPHDLRRK